MSLVKKPRLTAKKLAAIRRNQKLSHGPATAEGRERIRAAHLRHGYYSQSDEEALRALGEDPADFQELLEGLRDKATTIATLQDRLAHRLARALWRMNRADRTVDGYALRQAKEEDYTREARLHMQMMRLKMIARNWQLLAQSVARPKYVTTDEDLEMVRNLLKEGLAKEMGEVALALFYQLQEPGALRPGDPGFEDAEEQAKTQRVMTQIRAIFGLPPLPSDEEDAGEGTRQGVVGARDGVPVQDIAPDFSPALADLKVGSTEAPVDPSVPSGQAPKVGATEMDVAPDFNPAPEEVAPAEASEGEPQPDIAGAPGSESPIPSPESPIASPEAEEGDPHPDITEEEWQAREPVRQLLENILSRQVQIFEAQHQDMLRECLSGPSPYERAAEIVPTHPNTKLMQRLEDSQCRQLLRMTSLLMRLRRHERQMEDLGNRQPESML
jgi:hypothetical protein